MYIRRFPIELRLSASMRNAAFACDLQSNVEQQQQRQQRNHHTNTLTHTQTHGVQIDTTHSLARSLTRTGREELESRSEKERAHECERASKRYTLARIHLSLGAA